MVTKNTYTAYGYYDQRGDSRYQVRKIEASSPEEAAAIMDRKMKSIAKSMKYSMRHSRVTYIRDDKDEKILWDYKTSLGDLKKHSKIIECNDQQLDLSAKIYHLLDIHNLYGPDGCYTFPDGDTWRRDDK